MASLPGPAWSQSAWSGYPNNTAISVTSAGNVGIGTANPNGTLSVSGNNSNGVLTYVNNDASTGFAGIRVTDSGSAVNGLMLEYLNSGFSPIGVLGPNMGAIFSHSSASGGLVVGTNAPAPVRFFTGNLTAERMRIDGSGNVGIGITPGNVFSGVYAAPLVTMSQSDTATSSSNSAGPLVLVNPNNAAGNLASILFAVKNQSGNIEGNAQIAAQFTSVAGTGNSYPASDLLFLTNVAAGPAERMRITSTGNVGIGTPNPCANGQAPANCKLSVAGAIQAKEVVVNTGWSDYVFQPGYRLWPLSEVSAYVQANHHLPDIPSETEVKEKGVSLGEMQAKLLAKVEELTLHMIEAEKRNTTLMRQNRELQERVERLEGRIAR
jgi:hypothetical protein